MSEGTLVLLALAVVLFVVAAALILGFGPLLIHVLDRLPHAP